MRYRISSPIRRLAAFCIDFAFTWGIIFISFFSNQEYIVLGVMISVAAIKMAFWYDGTTLGKALLSMKVIDKDTKQKLSFWKMCFRQTIGKFISTLVMNVGFIWILIDNDKQGWHDKMCNDIVVDLVEIHDREQIDGKDDYIHGY